MNENIERKNKNYHSFTAAYVKSTGKPYFNMYRWIGQEPEEKDGIYYISLSEAKRLFIHIDPEQEPDVFSRAKNGYYGKYKVNIEPFIKEDFQRGLFSTESIHKYLGKKVLNSYKKVGYCENKGPSGINREDRFSAVFDISKSKQFKDWIEERASLLSLDNISNEQLEQMKHALGLPRSKKPYRNRFYIDSNNALWNDLVEKGFATKHGGWEEDMAYFRLTFEAAKTVYGKSMSKKDFDDL